MIPSLAIDQSLRANSIVDYLAERGYFAVTSNNEGWKYLCPVHGDTAPSFYVYVATKDKPENFFCYGCKIGGNLISLISHVEQISVGQAIRRVVRDHSVDDKDCIDYCMKQIKSVKDRAGNYAPEELSWICSRLCYDFLRYVKYSQPYLGRMERSLQWFDDCIARWDMQQAYSIYAGLSDVLSEQRRLYAEEQEKDRRETLAIYAGMR